MTAREKLLGMKVTCRSWVKQKPEWAPYRIYKVTGTYTNEWDRSGRSLPLGEWKTTIVTAFEVVHPDGGIRRLSHRYEAEQYIKALLAVRQFRDRGVTVTYEGAHP